MNSSVTQLALLLLLAMNLRGERCHVELYIAVLIVR
jgi:hypothetical protein